jgi:hypothetical protein
MKTRLSQPLLLLLALPVSVAPGCGAPEGDAAAPEEANVSQLSMAGAGPSAAGNRVSQPTLCSGTPETISGVVESVGIPGEGLTIDTGGSSQTVWGLGPIGYWSAAGVARPVVGDAVVAVVSRLTTSDLLVLLSLSVNGQLLELRDASTCAPLWGGRRLSSAASTLRSRVKQAAQPQVTALGAVARLLCVGSQQMLSGTVESVGAPGDGLTIDTGEGLVSVYGLGPAWYWSQQNISRPAAGDRVEVLISSVSTAEEPVILSISVNGQTLSLRDPATCTPLW